MTCGCLPSLLPCYDPEERPPYDTLIQAGTYEIRRYHPHLVASITIRGRPPDACLTSPGEASSSNSVPRTPITYSAARKKLQMYLDGHKSARKSNSKIPENERLIPLGKVLPEQIKHTPTKALRHSHKRDHSHVRLFMVLPYAYRVAEELPGLPSDPSITILQVDAQDFAVARIPCLSDPREVREGLLKALRDKKVAERFEISPSEWDIWNYRKPWSVDCFMKQEVAILLSEVYA